MKVPVKFCLLTLTILMTLGMTDRSAHAQQSYNEITIHGVPISCTADGGKRVPLIISDEAKKWGGGYAHTGPVKGPTLMLSPTYLNTLPRLAAFNLFYHECAHLALPMGVGLQNPEQESKADCYAVKEMRKHGLISSWEEFTEATAYLRTLKATGKRHRPGPERVEQAAQCAKVPVVRVANVSGGDRDFCRNLDKIFAGGESYLARFDFEKKSLLPDLLPIGWCYHDDGSLRCSKQFAREKKARSFANRLANKVRNCLPSDFKYEKSGGPGEWAATGHDWTNAETGHEISASSLYDGEFDFTLTFPK